MEKIGHNVIESRQKIYGPFRLIIPPDHIELNGSLNDLKDLLDLRHITELPKDEAAKFYTFVESMWYGYDNFNKGHLPEALVSFEQALSSAVNEDQKIVATQKVCHALARLGNFDEALTLCQKTLEFETLDAREHAWSLILIAWIKLQQNLSNEAEELYYQALDLIRERRDNKIKGYVNNGLGLIRKSRGQVKEAMAFYQRALEYWSISDDFYGIQAAYFNIGNLYKVWGDQSGKQDEKDQIPRYHHGIEWVMRCSSLCERMGIGNDMSQDQILLAKLHLKMGDIVKAEEYANIGNERALKSDNKLDIAYSYRMLGRVYMTKGERERAEEAYMNFLTYIRLVGLPKEDLNQREEAVKKILSDTGPQNLKKLT